MDTNPGWKFGTIAAAIVSALALGAHAYEPTFSQSPPVRYGGFWVILTCMVLAVLTLRRQVEGLDFFMAIKPAFLTYLLGALGFSLANFWMFRQEGATFFQNLAVFVNAYAALLWWGMLFSVVLAMVLKKK